MTNFNFKENPFKTKKTIEDMNELSKKLGISSTGDPIKDALAQPNLSPKERAKLSEDIKNKNKNNNNTKKTDTKAADSDLNSFLDKLNLSPKERAQLLEAVKESYKLDPPKATDSELAKSPKDFDSIKINPDTVDKVAEKLKEASGGKDSTGVEKEQTTEAKSEESGKETPKNTTKESTVETPKEPKQETPKNEEKAKKVIDGFDSSQFKFEDAANQELYNLALTNGIGTPIRLATGEIAIPITGTGKSIVVSDKFAKTLDKVKRDDPKEVSATLAQVLGGSPVKGYDAYNYANSKERAGTSNLLAKLFKKIDESSLPKEDKEKAKELVNEHPNIFKRLFVVGSGGLLGTAGLVGMGLYNDNDDQNTIEGIDGLNNRLDQDNPDNGAGGSGGGDSGDYSINLPEFGDPGNTAGTLQEAAAVQPSEEESEDTIGENQEYVIPDRGHTSEDLKQGNSLANETRLVTKDTPESTPYNPSYTPKDQMYNTGLSNPIPEQVAEQLAEVANTETPSKSNKKSTKASKATKATSGNNAPMAGSRPDVSAPGYGAAALSAALGQAAQGAPVDGYDRMFDPSLLEYMRRVSPNTAYGIEQEMRRRGMM